MALRFPVLLLALATLQSIAAQMVCDVSNWVRPNDKTLNPLTALADQCGVECQAIISLAITEDRQTIYGDIPYDASFYATSGSFNSRTSKPGDLLKFEPYINESTTWQIPAGVTLFSIEYVSIGVNNKSVPATGFVALPFAKPHNGGPIPLVAFAHGTIGVFSGCAPSSSFNLYDYSTWTPLWLQGYAVVAPDYHGLGNNQVAHPWNAPTLQANDVYYSVVAAKRALGNIVTKEWMAIGHSQGGGAVFALGTSDLVRGGKGSCPDVPLKFLGSVPISPAVRLADLVKYNLQNVEAYGTSSAEYAPYLYWGMEATNPGSGQGFLSDIMLKRTKLGQSLGLCFYGWGALGVDLALASGLHAIFRNISGVATYPGLLEYQQRFGAGLGRPASAPMLIVQSQGDLTVAASVTVEAFQTTCHAQGSAIVQLSMYSDLDHSATPPGAAPEWLQWIADRFAGKAIEASQCTEIEHATLNMAAAFLPSG